MELLNPLTVPRADQRYLRLTKEVACLSNDSPGDWVCIRGDRINGKWRVEKADIYDREKMPALGILLSKSTPTVGVIQTIGPCEAFVGLDWTEQSVWLGASGMQYTIPGAGPGGYAIVQRIGKPVASDTLWIAGGLEMYEVIT